MFWTFKTAATFTIIALLLTGMVACTAEPVPKLIILDAWTRPAATSIGTGAIYLTLVNEGNAADALVSASSDAAETAGLHETQMKEGIMSMVPVSRLEVPIGSRIELKPGGLHLMLMGLKQDLNPGDTVNVTLRFEKSDEITAEVEVRQP
jgi:hypothetical protein